MLHGTWIPENTDEYRQSGAFYLWVETIAANKGKKAKNEHPRILKPNPLEQFLEEELGIKAHYHQKVSQKISSKFLTLPSVKNAPLKSYELIRYSGEDIPVNFQLQQWRVYCYEVSTVDLIKLLNDIHFLFSYQARFNRKQPLNL